MYIVTSAGRPATPQLLTCCNDAACSGDAASTPSVASVAPASTAPRRARRAEVRPVRTLPDPQQRRGFATLLALRIHDRQLVSPGAGRNADGRRVARGIGHR